MSRRPAKGVKTMTVKTKGESRTKTIDAAQVALQDDAAQASAHMEAEAQAILKAEQDREASAARKASFYATLEDCGRDDANTGNRIATLAAGLPDLYAEVANEAAKCKALRKGWVAHFIAGRLSIVRGVTTTAQDVIAEQGDKKEEACAADFILAAKNGRALVSMAHKKANLDLTGFVIPAARVEGDAKRNAAKEGKPAAATFDETGRVTEMPEGDLVALLASLAPATFAKVLSQSAAVQYQLGATKGAGMADRHFCEKVGKAYQERNYESAGDNARDITPMMQAAE